MSKQPCYNEYNPIKQITVRYDLLVKFIEKLNKESMSTRYWINDLPKYFVEKKRKTGVITLGFYSHWEKGDVEHIVSLPAFVGNWNEVWVVVSQALKITNDVQDVAWQEYDAQILEPLKECT